MAFDFKKEHKELYAPKKRPGIIEVPPVTYVAVRGSGDPNEEGGAYQQTIAVLYAISYTIKMSKKGTRQIEGYTDFVLPPLEGFWWQDAVEGVDYAHKEAFNWIAVIRLPDFVTREVFGWAVEEATAKKKIDTARLRSIFGYARGSASSVCTLVATTTSLPRSKPWMPSRASKATRSTCRRSGATTRFICQTLAR